MIIKAFTDMFRLLFFRFQTEDYKNFGKYHLILGLFFTWLVGMGRYWDHPKANIWQHLGVGSVIYIFVLSAFIWLLGKLLKAENWSYIHVLTFTSLTSFPAILYAIPVERYYSMDIASNMNVWFLAIVALWRVLLLIFYFRRHGKLGYFATTVTTFLPLTLIVSALTALNLDHVIFRIMGGLKPEDKSANDAAYVILIILSYISVYAFVPLLISFVGLVIHRRWIKK
jgi:hypothetical protein